MFSIIRHQSTLVFNWKKVDFWHKLSLQVRQAKKQWVIGENEKK